MGWTIAVIVINALGGGAIALLFVDRFVKTGRQFRKTIKSMEKELATKKSTLEQLAELSLGMLPSSELDKYDGQMQAAEEMLRTEKGKATITEAEIEAVDFRLRELEELRKELEVSAVDAQRELDMLRTQQVEISEKNAALRDELKQSLDRIEQMIAELADSTAAVERLTDAKRELIECETKTVFYNEQIGTLNEKYMGLKKAYDALDIEYAQLYEKQQMHF